MKTKRRILSISLCVALIVTTLSPMTVHAASTALNMTLASNLSGERTNIQFLEGTPGDTHIVYTYQQNGETFKAVETATEDFSSVDCQIYQLDEDGEYIKNSTQSVVIDKEGNPQITIKSASGKTECRTIDLSSEPKLNLQTYSIARVPDWEWITEYEDGVKGGLSGLGINALIAVIAAIATFYSSGVLASVAVAGASTVATALFNRNAEKVYYHAIINWRHSPKSYFVIDETEHTKYYVDSSHKYYLGYTYAEYIF